MIAGNGNRWHPAGVGLWLRELGLFGQRSHDKHLPAGVFSFSDRQVGLLLRHLWATDGCISLRKPGQRGASRVYFATCSERLARDVAALLRRLAVFVGGGRFNAAKLSAKWATNYAFIKPNSVRW